jgi:hypothetical protein
LLPVARGKQRWTNQTFVVTGDRAQRLARELRAARVYSGPAPAGCQPDGERITVTLTSGARRLTFVTYCDMVWVGRAFSATLTSVAFVRDVEATVAGRRPTRSVAAPPRTATLKVGPIVVYDNRTRREQRVTGTVTVTQDGKVLGSKRLGADGHLTLHVAAGGYSVSGVVSGMRCVANDVTLVAGELASTGPACRRG